MRRDNRYRKGAADAIVREVAERGGTRPADLEAKVTGIAAAGGTPLVGPADADDPRRDPSSRTS